jgi:hypothetical protein
VAQRYDIGSLQSPERRADGTVVFDAHLTRTGVFTYRKSDGTERREYRPDSEVHDPKSLASFALVPVTNDHPPEMLSAKNARKYAVGATGERIRKDGDHVAAKVSIFDEATIAQMDSGKTQLSCGYDCDLDETPGVSPGGERYDAIQKNIVGNHLAIVDRGRAGSARVRMDAAVMDVIPESDSESVKRSDIMNLEQALAALANAQKELGAATSRADAAERARDENKKSLDVATARVDSLTEELTTERKARKDAEDAGPAKVRARVDLETKALAILPKSDDGKAFKVDGLSDREVQCAVIKHVTNVDVPKDKSADYVSARFDAAVERAQASTETFQKANTIIVDNHTRDAKDAGEAAKAENRKAGQNLFIQPKA